MNTQQIAERLVELFNKGEMETPYIELYSPNITSVEQEGEFMKCEGMEEVMKKGAWWQETFDVHSASASNPIVADDWFTVSFTMDTTHKPSGMRSQMTELAVYRTEEGKIVYEEFFYTPMKEN
ncbi:nuclear transport factor 2 family protein [uncultured Sulfitobacter sp.]|uniref:nuclear transport factor 2 family protein n=1 Tax=uncultured Sulfitobacter sp. TaxID=191468 RepID=UPI0025914796|nr:nuclear transport factor 2 family protein [uncultured Sulfitobacter sp.]